MLDMNKALMEYGRVCEEEGFLSPRAITIRMDLTAYYNLLVRQLEEVESKK